MSMKNPSSLLLTFAEKDYRLCFSIQLQNKQFLYLNPAFQRFFNVTIADANADRLLEFVHSDDREFIKQFYLSLNPGDFNDKAEFRVLLPDGKQYTLRLIAYLNGRTRDTGTLTGFMEDVTSFKEHERTLDDLSNKKNAILNILSHDLAGPLGAIQNYTYLLARKEVVTQDEQVSKMILAIEKICKRSTNLIQQLIKNEFLESTGVDVFKTRVNLVEKLNFFMDDYYGSQDLTKINFEFTSSSDKIYAYVDEPKFMQVFNNLISNSMKFTPDGGKISINLEDKEDTILITVTDTGIGIPKAYHAGLFDKFSKARRPSLRGDPPVGLGMHIIKTIVEWHYGKISFDSEENQGTTFYIEIPNSK
jgi:two-component system sensor histidine kinase VicK